MYSCKKPYTPDISEAVNSILVVEGTIAVGADVENRFLLSRLRILLDTSLNYPEPGAAVRIESESGQNWTLQENADGNYSANLSLTPNGKYKLKITTDGGKQYETGFLEVKSTPAIDSVTWEDNDDLNIYVHSHDPSNNTKYYRWEFRETWEYHASFETNLRFENGQIIFLSPADQTYACWSNSASSSIIIGNTTALSEDKVSYQLIQKLPRPDVRASFKYSILVRQYGLPEQAYEFWSILRKNTELTGSLFDPQPSQLPGNISCINDPAEPVIGFISAGIVAEKRMYVLNKDLMNWSSNMDSTCKPILPELVSESIAIMVADNSYGPVYYWPSIIPPEHLAVAKKNCMDCRSKGGTTTKPPYWQ